MVDVINDRWKSEINPETTKRKVPTATGNYPEIWVITEPNREKNTAELIGTAAHLAESLEGAVVAITPVETDSKKLASQGADKILELCSTDEQTIVRSIDKASGDQPPWGLLAPGTDWGRQVAGRLAVRWNSGLTGDAVGLEIREGRLIAFKPAFGGQLVAEISYSSFTQMATVRPGVLSVPKPRTPTTILVTRVNSETDSRIQVENRWKDDNADLLANATIVIGVGQGVDPNDYPILEKLAKKLGAEICATRKVTDQGWMPRARQVGITGHTIAPNLYIALGTSGKFNHMVGVRSAGTIVGINPDPQCELWEWCDIGFVGDWHKIFEKLVFQLTKTGVII